MLVADTSVLVEHLRGREAATAFLERESKRGPVLVPALVCWELWKGAETAREREGVESLLTALQPDAVLLAMARIAGELYREHRREGQERPAWDLLIAAHALFHGCPLATWDRAFAPIRGLDVVTPYTR
jgi:predicted nucleic acid-binding protein